MLFNEKIFQELSKIFYVSEPCVSILIPTHRIGHVQEDRICFKNALAEAGEKLQEENIIFNKGGMSEKEINEFLMPAQELLKNDEFWLHQSDGLAVFIGNNLFQHFEVPIHFEPLVYIHHHYYLRPLMPLLNKNDRFFLLALSQGEVRFFEGHQYSITPVNIKDLVPASYSAAMSMEDPEKSLQMHGSGDATVHHGQGTSKDGKDWQIEQYCRMVDDGLMEMLHDENDPMIIAGVTELVSVYKSISNYKNIVEAHVGGNPENDDPILLHEKSWAKMQPYFQGKIKVQKELFDELLTKNKASSTLLDIIPAAVNGKVETLFLAKDMPIIWGYHKEWDNTIDIHETREPQSICLINLAAVKTYENSGTVYIIDPTKLPAFTAQANAIYRYQI